MKQSFLKGIVIEQSNRFWDITTCMHTLMNLIVRFFDDVKKLPCEEMLKEILR